MIPHYELLQALRKDCIDTWFGTTLALGVYTCAQLYYCVKIKYIAFYPITAEFQGPTTLEDLCRDRESPLKLKNDKAQMEIGKAWTSICRKYNIIQCTTEAHTTWQKEAERYIQEVRKVLNITLDHHTGARTTYMGNVPYESLVGQTKFTMEIF